MNLLIYPACVLHMLMYNQIFGLIYSLCSVICAETNNSKVWNKGFIIDVAIVAPCKCSWMHNCHKSPFYVVTANPNTDIQPDIPLFSRYWVSGSGNHASNTLSWKLNEGPMLVV